MPRVLSTFLLALLTAGTAPVPSSGATLTENFSGDWRASWREKTFTRKPNLTETVVEQGNVAVRVNSRGAAGGFWREWKHENPRSGRFAWRWKIKRSLDNPRERSKAGDDYAARVKVIFETRFPAWRTRALCYVWAGREPAGSLYRNPYSGSVGTIVVESGDALAGTWVREERDFMADYERYFGSKPGRISGIAFMVDTDDTKSEAVAWFDDFSLEVRAGEAGLSLPVLQTPACPFECCQFGRWVIGSRRPAYAEARDTSRAAFTINPGDAVPAELIEHPVVIWWVRVSNASGTTGWLRLQNVPTHGWSFDVSIQGSDGCG